jgi:D-3-phosphoglycerate dehydrogenase
LTQLLQQSEFVSLHLPATAANRHLIGKPQFEQMRPTAWLINTSRGSLVDEHALWQALQGNRLAGAALDVFDPEPPTLAHPLFRDERVIITPHAAFVSPESVVELRTRVARQVAAVLSGGRPENIVNPLAVRG